MKIITYFFVASLFLISACNLSGNETGINADVIDSPYNSDGTIDSTKLPVISFVNDSYDFGKIVQGDKVQYSFVFKNTGKASLVISSSSATCGCTVPSYPQKPILPGEEGKIDVIFDSKGRMGIQNKSITIVANTIPNTKTVTLIGEVLASKE